MKTNKNVWIPDFGLKGWSVIILAGVFYYLGQSVFDAGLNTIFSVYSGLYGWSVPLMASFVTIGGWIAIISMAIFGVISKKKGPKFVSIISLFLVAIFFVILGVTNSLMGFAIAVMGYMICAVGFQTIGVGQFGANWFPRSTGRYMGIATMGLTAAGATINPIMMSVTNSKGISFFMYAAAVVCLIVIVLIVLFIKNYPEEAGAYPDNDKTVSREELIKEAKEIEEYKKNSPWTLKKVLTFKGTWQVGIGWSLPMMAAVGIVGQLGFALQDYGHDFMFGIMLLSTVWPLGIIGSYICGVIDDKYGTKLASVLVVILELIGTLIILFFGTNPFAAAIGVGIMLFSISGVTNITVSMSTTIFGRRDFDSFYPSVAVIFKFMISAGVTVMAMIAASSSYKAAFILMVILCLVSIVIMVTTSDKCISDSEVKVEKA